jgi:hypothetical protein
LLANHFAWGVVRHDGRLAVAFEQRGFDHARQVDAGFDALIRKWEVRGCELVEHLGFVKDATALRPVRDSAFAPHVRPAEPPPPGHAAAGEVRTRSAPRPDELAAAKQVVAREAIARSWLGVEQTLQRYAILQRLAAAFPYLLILIATAATVGAGLYIRERLVNSDRESRHETIERMVVDEPHGQSLAEP